LLQALTTTMLSFKTCIELINVIDNYIQKVVDRIFAAFDLEHKTHPTLGKFNKDDKINILLKALQFPPPKGPFSDSFQLDLLQYIVDHFYRYEDEPQNRSSMFYDNSLDNIPYDDKFSYKYPALANSLKRDGYIMKGRIIRKMLPTEIEEAKTESELFILLNQFNFSTTKGHLEQAILNHSQGNWAGANGQFRPFIESLLIDICKKLLPNNKCENASSAISLLSKTVNPSFLRADLNEVENNNCNKPFIEGFWKRLHPEGNHPGLSDEEDSTFRYHISIVVALNLLNRLTKRN
jgi:hypothetical protein